eukprot:928296_1
MPAKLSNAFHGIVDFLRGLTEVRRVCPPDLLGAQNIARLQLREWQYGGGESLQEARKYSLFGIHEYNSSVCDFYVLGKRSLYDNIVSPCPVDVKEIRYYHTDSACQAHKNHRPRNCIRVFRKENICALPVKIHRRHTAIPEVGDELYSAHQVDLEDTLCGLPLALSRSLQCHGMRSTVLPAYLASLNLHAHPDWLRNIEKDNTE